MNYFPFHLGDYAAHTAHLEPMEDLAYRRLLDQYYLREGPLPFDIQVTAKLVRMRSMAADVESVLKEFFTLTDSGWTHDRCEAEIAHMQDKQVKARASAAASVKSRQAFAAKKSQTSGAPVSQDGSGCSTDAKNIEAGVQLPTPTPTPTPTPITKNTRAVAPPVGVTESVWSDFCQHRKAKGAKLTQTAMDGIQAEASKAGWSLENALRECCSRGWTGFKADWVAERPAARDSPTGETAYQRSMRERVAEFSPSIARKAPGTYPLENMILEAENVTAIAGN